MARIPALWNLACGTFNAFTFPHAAQANFFCRASKATSITSNLVAAITGFDKRKSTGTGSHLESYPTSA